MRGKNFYLLISISLFLGTIFFLLNFKVAFSQTAPTPSPSPECVAPLFPDYTPSCQGLKIGDQACDPSGCKIEKIEDCGCNLVTGKPLEPIPKTISADCSPYSCSNGSCTKNCSKKCGAQCEGGSYTFYGTAGCGPNCTPAKLDLKKGSSSMPDVGTKLALKSDGKGIYAPGGYAVFRERGSGPHDAWTVDPSSPCISGDREKIVKERGNEAYIWQWACGGWYGCWKYWLHPWQASIKGNPPSWDFPVTRYPEKPSCISVVKGDTKYCYCPEYLYEIYRWEKIQGCPDESKGTTQHSANYNPLCSQMQYPKDRWQRVFYDENGNCLGDGPDEPIEKFDNSWEGENPSTYCQDKFKFKSSRLICTDDQIIVLQIFLGAQGGNAKITVNPWPQPSKSVSASADPIPPGPHGLQCGDCWLFQWECVQVYNSGEYQAVLDYCVQTDQPPPNLLCVLPTLSVRVEKGCHQFEIEFEKTDSSSARLIFDYGKLCPENEVSDQIGQYCDWGQECVRNTILEGTPLRCKKTKVGVCCEKGTTTACEGECDAGCCDPSSQYFFKDAGCCPAGSRCTQPVKALPNPASEWSQMTGVKWWICQTQQTSDRLCCPKEFDCSPEDVDTPCCPLHEACEVPGLPPPYNISCRHQCCDTPPAFINGQWVPKQPCCPKEKCCCQGTCCDPNTEQCTKIDKNICATYGQYPNIQYFFWNDFKEGWCCKKDEVPCGGKCCKTKEGEKCYQPPPVKKGKCVPKATPTPSPIIVLQK